jgi:hypothetical protein
MMLIHQNAQNAQNAAIPGDDAKQDLQHFYIVFAFLELRGFNSSITIGPPEILFTTHSTIVLEEVLCASQQTHPQYAFNGLSASRSSSGA